MGTVRAAAVQRSPVLYSREGTVRQSRRGHQDSRLVVGIRYHEGDGARRSGRGRASALPITVDER